MISYTTNDFFPRHFGDWLVLCLFRRGLLDQFVPLLAAHVILAQLLPLFFGGIPRNPAAMKRRRLTDDLPLFQFGFAVFRRALQRA